MGCSQSQLEPDEEARSSSHPPAHGRRHLYDVRLRRDRRDRRGRKDGFVTATDILRPEGSEAGDDLLSLQPPRRSTASRSAHDASKEVKEADGEKKKGGLGSGKVGKLGEEDELPGSPSFRFYFEGPGPWVTNDSTKVADDGKIQGI